MAALLVGAGSAIGATVSGTPNGAPPPWYGAPQTITWTVDDPAYTFSGQPTATTTAGNNGTDTYTSPEACNGVDPCITGSVTLGLDLTPPTITANETPGPNAFGWNKTPVTVSFPCSDALSGLATACPTAVTLGETAGETVTRSVSDNVGHIGSATSSVIRIDMMAPNIAAAGQSPPKNVQGWNNTSVTAIFSCGDPGTFASGVDPSAIDPTYDPTDDPSAVGSGIPGCPTVTKTASGAGQTATTTVTDRAGNVSGQATVTGINIDKVAPTVTVSVPPASTPTYEQGQIVGAAYGCTDALSGMYACTGTVANGVPFDTTQGGTNQLFSVTGTDNAGNPTPVARTYKIKPAAAQLVTPANGVTTNDHTPEFRWNNSLSSSIDHYELHIKGGKVGPNIPQSACIGTICQTAVTTGDLGPPFAALKTALPWFVRAVGTNGTSKDSLIRTVTIDPSVPNAPTLTGGPVGLTNQATPTFTWAGSGTSFPWKVRRSGDDAVIQQSTASGLQVTVGPLPDGAYTFEVQQAGANGVTGDAAVLAFTVDASPPGPPTIVSGPGASTDVRTPTFAWVGEAGGSFAWTVFGGAGPVRSGTTAARSATVAPALDPGLWTFVVQQVDAAGNSSAPSGGYTFIINPPPAPSTPPAAVGTAAAKPPSTVTAKKAAKRSNSVLTPRTINARKLSPKAGAKVRSLRPVLRWKLRPKGVKIYNLQMFLNSKKILSRFPTGQSFKVPKGVLKPGKRYVWRIWPYFGPTRGYPSKPLGLSYLDIVAVKKKTVAKATKK